MTADRVKRIPLSGYGDGGILSLLPNDCCRWVDAPRSGITCVSSGGSIVCPRYRGLDGGKILCNAEKAVV